jgi:hypothetical protein
VRQSKAQLWGLLVVASVDPRLGPEKGTDGGELVKVESRQLDGIAGCERQSVRVRVGRECGRTGTPWMLRSRRGRCPRCLLRRPSQRLSSGSDVAVAGADSEDACGGLGFVLLWWLFELRVQADVVEWGRGSGRSRL